MGAIKPIFGAMIYGHSSERRMAVARFLHVSVNEVIPWSDGTFTLSNDETEYYPSKSKQLRHRHNIGSSGTYFIHSTTAGDYPSEPVPYLAVCKFCEEKTLLQVNLNHIAQWKKGALPRDVFNYLSSEDRELLVSQTCGDCWNDMFKGWDDEQ